MPMYEYECESNQRTVSLLHPMDVMLRTWGELCYVARIPLGDTDPAAPVRRCACAPAAIHVPSGNSDLKQHGFTKLVRRDQGVYENVTATGTEQRYFRAGDIQSMPHLHRKIED